MTIVLTRSNTVYEHHIRYSVGNAMYIDHIIDWEGIVNGVRAWDSAWSDTSEVGLVASEGHI